MGRIVGNYALALGQTELVFPHYSQLNLRHSGLVAPHHPSKLQVKVTGPDLKLGERVSGLIARLNPRNK